MCDVRLQPSKGIQKPNLETGNIHRCVWIQRHRRSCQSTVYSPHDSVFFWMGIAQIHTDLWHPKRHTCMTWPQWIEQEIAGQHRPQRTKTKRLDQTCQGWAPMNCVKFENPLLDTVKKNLTANFFLPTKVWTGRIQPRQWMRSCLHWRLGRPLWKKTQDIPLVESTTKCLLTFLWLRPHQLHAIAVLVGLKPWSKRERTIQFDRVYPRTCENTDEGMAHLQNKQMSGWSGLLNKLEHLRTSWKPTVNSLRAIH